MNKTIKFLILIISIIILVVLGYFGYAMLKPDISKMPYVPVDSKVEISNIAADSFLDILIETKKYDSSKINYENMLKASMRIARELNLLKEMSSDTNFYEYVSADTIHSMIEELTGQKVPAPIDIEDFYYLYNKEDNYYYIVPVGTDWIHINEIKEVKNINDGKYYTITCSTAISDDGIASYDYGDVTVTLKYCPENKYIRYQLVSMEHTVGTHEEI